MQMTKDEIVRDYLSARNKQKQIKILADLNDVVPAEIRKILAEAGVAGVKPPVRTPSQKKTPPAAVPAVAPDDFFVQVETVLADLPDGMTNDAAFCAQELLQVLFRDYVDSRLRKKVRHE